MTPARHAAMRARRQPWWTSLVQWRNWRLPVKLGAVLMVPALFAVVAGVVQIRSDVARANSYADDQRLVSMRAGLMSLIDALQQERTLTAENLRLGGRFDEALLQKQRQRVDTDENTVLVANDRLANFGSVVPNRYREADDGLAHLTLLRKQVASGSVGTWDAVNEYTTVIKDLLNLDQALVSRFGDPALSGPATALYDLEVVGEEISLEQVTLPAVTGPGQSAGPAEVSAFQESDARLRDKLGDFRAVATPAEQNVYQQTVTSPAVTRRDQTVSAVLAELAARARRGTTGTAAPIRTASWDNDSDATSARVEKTEGTLANELSTVSASLQDQTSNLAGVETMTLFLVLLVACAIGFAIGRNLLRSLTLLRSTALDVAEHRLPAAVRGIREGEVANATIDAVPVHTTEELGQLARAFDAVQGQAVRLATEQAALRGDLRNTLVNLSRRSQSLVDRLLVLMEQLERHEDDPDQLANLFTLDHLATRMRRNNENLMILCGSTLVRPSSQAVALGTVLRGAVSEIERYQRVLVQPTPSIDVIGYAAGDLGRLVAELLDNATAFSPPHTQVVIGSARGGDGSVLIEVRDQGIGMSESDLAAANERLAADSSMDAPTSRQLGLFVVGRLASRHGFAVRLRHEAGGAGLRAEVLVPAELVRAQEQDSADRPQSALNSVPAPVRGGRPDGGAATPQLPKRPVKTATERRPVLVGAERRGEPSSPSWFNAPGPEAEPPVGGGAQSPDPVARPHADENEPEPVRPQSPGTSDGRGATARPEPGPEMLPHPEDDKPERPSQAADLTQAGLPRRLPRARSAPAQAEPATAAGEEAPTSLDARHTRNFLSSYQAGIRRAQPDQTT